jgi:hypothetical protein
MGGGEGEKITDPLWSAIDKSRGAVVQHFNLSLGFFDDFKKVAFGILEECWQINSVM